MGLSPIVSNQAESLRRLGLEVDIFTVKGKGLKGYLISLLRLNYFLMRNDYQILHAHYSLSAFVASCTYRRLPLIVSLMGSDAQMGYLFKLATQFFSRFCWDKIIIKSLRMNENLRLKSFQVLPNGVDIIAFHPSDRREACSKVGFNPQNTNIIFMSDPNRFEKNFQLAESCIALLRQFESFDFHVIYNVENKIIPYYLNASDILISTSLWEGSPNIVKEAMACNTCVVCTDVGDVKWLFGETPGYFLTDGTVEDTVKVHKKVEFHKFN